MHWKNMMLGATYNHKSKIRTILCMSNYTSEYISIDKLVIILW
jgi:hypothetical protein